jgi:hypothetical protein
MQGSLFPQTSSSGAIFSDCHAFRYLLWRIWKPEGPIVLFIGLNPSTANETENDPTIRRCVDFATRWGYGGMYMANLFAFRTPHPKLLRKAEDPIGAENDFNIKTYTARAQLTVLMWGNHGLWLDRWKTVLPLVSNPYCLTVTKLGQPGHPLYLNRNCKPIPYRPPQV